MTIDARANFGSPANAVRIRLRVNQTSSTATTATVRYRLDIERPSGSGYFALAGAPNSYSIDTNPGTNISGTGYTFDFRSPTATRVFNIVDESKTFQVSGSRTLEVSATAMMNTTQTTAGDRTANIPLQTMVMTSSGFTLSYNSNGGAPTPTSQTLAGGASFTAAAEPFRSGFIFDFWGGSDSNIYFPGSTYTMPSSNLTLTASWSVPPPPAPPAPTNFTSTAIATTSINTSWSGSSGATGYRVFNGSTLLTTLNSSTLNYNFTGLTPNTSYTLGVRAIRSNSGGTSQSSLVTITRSTLPVTFFTPNVLTQLRDTAIVNLRNAGFATNVNVTNVTAGATAQNNRAVLLQSPTAGTTATSGDTASISVYDFRVAMPSILGLTQTAANTSLTNAGLPLRTSSLVTSGATLANNLTVASQTPSSGTQFNIAETVTYTIFNFLIPVPNVVNLERTQGIINLNNAGFTSVNINLDIANATAQNVGTIKSQSPINSATTFNPQTTTVTLTVYSFGIAGKRSTGTGFSQINTARRFDGSIWRDLTVQRRFDGSVWRDIIN